MKNSTRRSIPPPINLGISGSNILRAGNSQYTSDKDMVLDRYHSNGYGSQYILDMSQGTSPMPTPTPSSSSSSSSSGLIQVPTPDTSTNTSATSASDGSFLSVSEWDSSRLVPNRRRRSYSEVSDLLRSSRHTALFAVSAVSSAG